MRSFSNLILNDLERVLQEQAPNNDGTNNEHSFELPQLVIDGIPTPVDKMNQVFCNQDFRNQFKLHFDFMVIKSFWKSYMGMGVI